MIYLQIYIAGKYAQFLEEIHHYEQIAHLFSMS